MAVHVQPEYLFTLSQNRCSSWAGICILLIRLTEALISEGRINPKGKNIDDLIREALEIWKVSKLEIKFSDDSTADLIERAQVEREGGDLYLSVLFCALWFEHWINFVILKRAIQLGIDEKDIYSFLRETNIRAKTGWLLKLIKLPPLSEQQMERINHILELRNSFAHYKWNTFLLEEDNTAKKYEDIIDNFMLISEELKNYEIANIFNDFVPNHYS